MNQIIREAFEAHTLPNFRNDESYDDTIEDHWQTFQEGWESAIKFLQEKKNNNYTDIISTGGYDARNA
jgi:hypothetical protein